MLTPSRHRGPAPAIVVPGYRVLGRCWDDARTVTFSGEDAASGASVFIRTPKAHRAAPRATELKRDHDIAASIGGGGILRPLAHLAHDGGEFLILEDDGTRPVGEVLLEKRLGLLACLGFGVRLASVLDRLHRAQIVHGNINAYSVWLDRRTLETRITDFSIASRGHELPAAGAATGPVDLLYAAPEQTGRISRAVDSRSDLYAAGVLLYHLLAGRPPFDETDSIGLIHAHLARLPPPPHVVDRRVPEPLSAIVMKLLSKPAEERYQSARGLQSDLEECLAQWRARGSIDSIAIGAQDAAASFRISEKFYNRRKELAALRAALDRAAHGSSELVLVSGAPGIGKSLLVRTIEPEARRAGAFIAAKFDQFKQNEPYSFIIQGFKELIQQLLAGTEEAVRAWRDRLIESLGVNGRVIIDVIPEVELLVGSQPPVQLLPAAEKRNRFNRVFRSFVRVFAREDHPLCMFLDDLQWADPASLTLLRTLLTDRETRHFLVIGAYRDTELGDAGGLVEALDGLRGAGVAVSEINLPQLEPRYVGELLGDTFRCAAEDVAPLTALVLQKTDGNPFFVNQFLSFLHHDCLIEFDYARSRWDWDLRRISAQGVTEDVLELMSRKLDTLPALTQEALKAAACMGSRFDLPQLALVMRQEPSTVLAALRVAEREGLILATESGEGRRDGGAPAEDGGAAAGIVFRFLHDRVQQAAYALIPAGARHELRLRIGRTLLGELSAGKRGEIPFAILDNLNDGADLVADPAEREEFARLNLLAGRRARESAAYDAALGYFRSGMRLLPSDSWQNRYELTLDLRLGCFECAYATGRAEEANALFGDILGHARSRVDKAKAFYTKILLSSGLDRSEEAVALGREALLLFGEALPAAPSRLRLLRELARVAWLLRGRRADDLLERPPMSDADRMASINLLMSICPAAYFRNPDLMSLAALRIMGMSLVYGNAGASSFGYVLYGLIRGALLADYRRGHEFGRLAVDLAARDGSIVQRGKILMIFAGFINYWRRPIDSSIEMLRASLKLALDAGDVQYANYSILQIIFLSLARGADLDEVHAECARHGPFVEQTKDWFTIASHGIRRQSVLALRSETESGSSLSDAEYDEEAAVAGFRAAGNLTVLSYYLVVKMQLAYLFGEFEEAHRHAEASEAQVKAVVSQIVVAEHYFYRGLIAAALIRRQGPRRELWRILRRCRARLRRWARHCPENFRQHHFLLEAEFAALRGRAARAERCYDEAAAAAQLQGFRHIEALAGELAAESYLARGRRPVAKAYLLAARQAYARWGATAKLHHLSRRHASLLDDGTAAPGTGGAPRPDDPPSEQRELIDLDTLMRATTEISAEREADRLLGKLMRLVLESAGGERGFFITEHRGELRVEAAGTADGGRVRLRRGPDADDASFSAAVVTYVLRTGHRLVLADAGGDPRFGSCPDIRSRRPRSVLCVPLAKKGELVGAVYVENNLAPGAFTADRLQPLTLLSHQIAVVLENSRLERDLTENSTNLEAALRNVELLERVKDHLTKFVPQSIQRLIETNPRDPDFGTRNEDVSILFLDIAGYTRLSERFGSEELNRIVETYFSSFLDDIHGNHGDINEIAGDGLMIIFQSHDPNEHARLAARTALAVRGKTAALNEEARGEWPPVVINVGIHSGVALIGANKIESNMGTRWIYTATGYAANLAARIGASATDGAILVSEATAARLGDAFDLEEAGPQSFKGISRPVPVFRVLGERAGRAARRAGPA